MSRKKITDLVTPVGKLIGREISKKEMAALSKKIAMQLKKEEDERNKPPTPKVVGSCKVCGGDIVEDIQREFDPRMGPPIFGPGSKKQFRYVHHDPYCTKCRLRYKAPIK